MGERRVGYGLDFLHFSIRRLACHWWNRNRGSLSELRYSGDGWLRIACWNIRHNDIPSTIPACMPNPMILRVYWSITTNTQCVRKVADSHRNKSTLHRLSFIWPRKVSQDGPPVPGAGRNGTAIIRRTTSLSISIPKAKVTCCAILGHPQVGLRCFIWTTASISSRCC
jgi:hypothetical protein